MQVFNCSVNIHIDAYVELGYTENVYRKVVPHAKKFVTLQSMVV